MKTFYSAADMMNLERYRVLARYKKQKIWKRSVVKRIAQLNNIIAAGSYISSKQ